MSNQVPVWTGNRGTVMMVKVGLAQSDRTPIFVTSLTDLEKAVSDTGAKCVVVGLAEIRTSGLEPATLAEKIGKDILYVILSVGQPVPDVPGVSVRQINMPFSATELRQAVESAVPESARRNDTSSLPAASDLTTLVRAEIERIVLEKAESMVAEAVMKMVPELAETMIKTELDRLLSEAAGKAVSTDPAPDDED